MPLLEMGLQIDHNSMLLQWLGYIVAEILLLLFEPFLHKVISHLYDFWG